MGTPKEANEGASFLMAINIKDNFKPSENDFLPVNLGSTVLRVTRQHDDMEAHCEKLATDELKKEFAHFRKELKNYLVVLKSIQDVHGKDETKWKNICFFLDPATDPEESPSMEQQKDARQLLSRFAGFSTYSAAIIESLIRKRLAREEEKVRLMMERNKKKSGGSMGGFLNKLGFKL